MNWIQITNRYEFANDGTDSESFTNLRIRAMAAIRKFVFYSLSVTV